MLWSNLSFIVFEYSVGIKMGYLIGTFQVQVLVAALLSPCGFGYQWGRGYLVSFCDRVLQCSLPSHFSLVFLWRSDFIWRVNLALHKDFSVNSINLSRSLFQICWKMLWTHHWRAPTAFSLIADGTRAAAAEFYRSGGDSGRSSIVCSLKERFLAD